jgi:hypothetical protein
MVPGVLIHDVECFWSGEMKDYRAITNTVAKQRAIDLQMAGVEIPFADIWVTQGEEHVSVRVRPDAAPVASFELGVKGEISWTTSDKRYRALCVVTGAQRGSPQFVVTIEGGLEEDQAGPRG